MKLAKLILVMFISLLFYSCNEESPIVSSSNSRIKGQALLKLWTPPLPQINFNIWGLDGYPDSISIYGPTDLGWDAINLSVMNYSINDFRAARNAGYKYIIAVLDRNSIINFNWTEIQNEVGWAILNGATSFYVDDGLCSGQINRDQISKVASYVHKAGKRLATAEWYNVQKFQQNPHWHDSVDIINAYGYSSNTDQLNSFLNFLKTTYPSKQIIPVLGYNVLISGVVYSQKGSKSCDLSFIENVINYSTPPIIEYYYEGDRHWAPGSDPTIYSRRRELTSYLSKYYGLANPY